MNRGTTLLVALFFACLSWADGPKDFPLLVEKLPNPNDYTLFANGGWDGNWYVGYNTCWITQLPAIPPGNYKRAYIGVKLGRAKVDPAGKRPWDKQALAGDIYAAISSTTGWPAQQQLLVTHASSIPLEGDGESAIEGVGESQWFWAPVPIDHVNQKGNNFVAVWSPTPAFLTVSSSPVLAAGWGGKEVDSWLLRDVKGAPPRRPVDPNPGISYFRPGIALKLIPAEAAAHPLSVRVVGWTPGAPEHLKNVVTVSVSGDAVESVWIEALSERKGAQWQRIGRPLWQPPFTFSLNPEALPSGKTKLRAAAVNLWEEESASEPFNVVVAPLPAKP
jgi:hypothetical protein